MAHPNTYYSQTITPHAVRAPLEGEQEADVCVIGGGLAGLSCARELSLRGQKVILLEGKRLAWGASGRNGGFVSAGFAQGLSALEAKLGQEQAQALFALSREGVEIVGRTLSDLAIKNCRPSPGMLSVIRYHDPDSLRRQRDRMARDYDHELAFVPREELRYLLNTPRYHQGLLDPNAFHFHPLNYCLGLANSIEELGGRIFEGSEATRLELDKPEKEVHTAHGCVKAKQVVFCGGGYGGPVFERLYRAFLPIATYVVVTEPLGETLLEAVRTKMAVVDDRQASDYYRVVDGNRLLWGGRITTRTNQPAQLQSLLKRDMLSVYPQLGDVQIETAWSGLMAYARHKMPIIGPVRDGVWSCTGFGGHGMNTAPIGGRVIAEAICGESDRYRLFAPFGMKWNGGPLGTLAAQSIYWSLRLSDWMRERRSQTA